MARKYGISSGLLFHWRQLKESGGVSGPQAGEAVVPESEVQAPKAQVRELQRLLGCTAARQGGILTQASNSHKVVVGPLPTFLEAISVNIDEMKEQLRKNNERIEQMFGELEGHVPTITAAVTDEIVKWSRARARAAAEAFFSAAPLARQPVLAAKLPALQEAVEAVIARLPSLTERALDELATWQHRPGAGPRTNLGIPMTHPGSSSDAGWEDVLDRLGHFVARPLSEYGFLTPDSGPQQGWRKNSESRDPHDYKFVSITYRSGGDRNIKMPSSVVAALQPYKTQLSAIGSLQAENKKLEKEIAKASFAAGWPNSN